MVFRVSIEAISPPTITVMKITRLNLVNTLMIGLNGFLDILLFMIYYFVKTSIVNGSMLTVLLRAGLSLRVIPVSCIFGRLLSIDFRNFIRLIVGTGLLSVMVI
jgi:hypothetical protein